MSDLRVAVIGVGHLGREHARILASLPGARLVAVVDLVPERAQASAAATGAKPLTDIQSLIGHVDAVTVAVPTDIHVAVARPFRGPIRGHSRNCYWSTLYKLIIQKKSSENS